MEPSRVDFLEVVVSLVEDSLAAKDPYQEGGFREKYLKEMGCPSVEGSPWVLSLVCVGWGTDGAAT